MERKSRSQLIGELLVKHNYRTMAEIGLSRGDNVRGIRKYLKEQTNPIHLMSMVYGIDSGETAKTNGLFRVDLERLAGWAPFRYLKYTSDDAIKYITTPLDLVFVDGSHEPAQIEKDIKNYSKLIAQGGMLVGDDYNDFTGKGIKEVVNRIIGADNIRIQLDERLESGRDNYLWYTQILHSKDTPGEFGYLKILMNSTPRMLRILMHVSSLRIL